MISRDWINRALQVRHFTLGAIGEIAPIYRSSLLKTLDFCLRE